MLLIILMHNGEPMIKHISPTRTHLNREEAAEPQPLSNDTSEERARFMKVHYEMYLKENPDISPDIAAEVYEYAHRNLLCAQLRESHYLIWLMAKQDTLSVE